MGGVGNDSLDARNGGGNNLLMAGDEGNFNVLVAGKSTDTLMGGTGNDFLTGSVEGDTLSGNTLGVDTLEGFKGADSLIGSAAADAFLYASILDAGDGVQVNADGFVIAGTQTSNDTIRTFDSEDKIYLNRSGFGLVEEAISGLRTNIDFFTTDTPYNGTFLTNGAAKTSAIIFAPDAQGRNYLLWDANGGDANTATDAIVTIALIQSGEITRDDIFLF
jgi:Ca2+-binding RTX toxin-like protein